MKSDLTEEQVKYAVARFISLYQSREWTQTELAQSSGVNQSTISKIVDGDKYVPSADILEKLFNVLGFKLANILNEDHLSEEIVGYLATPLTGLTAKQDKEVRRVVQAIREIATQGQSATPPFGVYWPGDHTHPKDHVDLSPSQVYITDRSRAATHDFIILFCGAPSYGVGQENEIATQAGVPAIRLIPGELSRMMAGSFIRAEDIQYSGSLDSKITFDSGKLRDALEKIRDAYFRRRAFYQGLNGDVFGKRLRRLVESRCNGNFDQFADDIGVSLLYLHKMMDEPFSVSNPSARILKRMAHRLGERVAFLLGEAEENDPVWVESQASWRSWIEKTESIEASVALRIRDDWRHEYATCRREQPSAASFRRSSLLMGEKEWDKQYQHAKRKGVASAQQPSLL